MAGKTDSFMTDILPMRLSYGAIEGADRLRDAICGMYQKQAHETLVEPGDRVISVLPTYQQHYSIPKSYGADVQILPLHVQNGFLPDLAET